MRQLPEGFYVKYQHDRIYADPDWISPLPTGGTTTANVYDGDSNLVATGESKCSPNECYNKRLGRGISLGRALAQLDGTAKQREARKQLEMEARVIQELAKTFGTF